MKNWSKTKVRKLLCELESLGLINRIYKGYYEFNKSLFTSFFDVLKELKVHSIGIKVITYENLMGSEYKEIEIDERNIKIVNVRKKSFIVYISCSDNPIPFLEFVRLYKKLRRGLERKLKVKIKRMRIIQVELNRDSLFDRKIYIKGKSCLECWHNRSALRIYLKNSNVLRKEVRLHEKSLSIKNLLEIVRTLFSNDLTKLHIYRLEREIEELKKEIREIRKMLPSSSLG